MPLVKDTADAQSTTVLVAVRVPHGSDGDLASAAERMLSRVDGVRGVSVDELRDIEPGLSATVVTATVTVRTSNENTAAELCERLSEAVPVESVESPD